MIRAFLVIQVVSGIILSFLYVPEASFRFFCVADFIKEDLLT